MSDQASAPEGLTVDSAASKLSGLLGGAPEKKTQDKRPVAEAGSQEPPAEVDQGSPTGEAAPEEAPPSSGDEQEADPADGQPTDLPPIEPPASWDASGKEKFLTLPRDAQEIIHRREQERDKEVRRVQNELAEAKKGQDAQRAEITSKLQQHFNHLAGLADALQQQIADEFADIKTPADLARLATDDPQRYLRWDAKQKLMAHANQERMAFNEAQRIKAERERAERLLDEKRKLSESEARELAAEGEEGNKARTALAGFLSEMGFAPAEIGSLEDSRLAVVAWLAMQHVKAKKSVATAKVTALPPAVLRPGAAPSRQTADVGVTAALVQRARKTGTVQDAGRALARLIS